MISGLTLNRDYAQFVFNSLIFQLVYDSIITSEDVEVSGMKIWVDSANVIIYSSAIGIAMFIVRSNFLDNLLPVSKNYKFSDVILPCRFQA